LRYAVSSKLLTKLSHTWRVHFRSLSDFFKEIMVAIDSVGSNTLSQQLISNTPSVTGSRRDTDGDNDNSGASVSRAAAGGSRVASAIAQALTSIGVTPADASGPASASTGTANSPQQARQAFAQALFGALHDQTNGAAASGGGSGGSGGVKHAGGGHHHGGGAGKVESGLQNLIQQLGASGTASSAGDGTSTATSDNSDLSKLQDAFNNLVSANGGTSGNASLTSFLQSMAQSLQAAPSSGNVVNTSA
jgi:hypothetical protein